MDKVRMINAAGFAGAGESGNSENKKKVEVLAPAGSFDIMKAVVAAGADAVYLGGSMFGARAFAGNLDREELIEAIEYAHIFGRKVYLTVNTLLKQSEIDGSLTDYIAPFYEAGLDAVIVQDLGVMRLIHENMADLNIHASTQMTQTGLYGSRLLKELGVSRIVTSREMSLGEIRHLHDNLDIEIESFVHGALCYSYSGQCLLSSFNGARSGNRGRCAQPCRMPYRAYDGDLPINSGEDKYLLSPKDMCALEILPDVIESGVYSLKIEGRMKNVTYAAAVTAMYRKYVDMYLARGRDGYKVRKEDMDDLADIYNRGAFTTGYYNNSKGARMMSLVRPNHMGLECLKVKTNVSGKVTFVALRDVNRGDVFEIDSEHSFESGADVKKGGTLTVNLPRKYPLHEGRIVNRMNNARIVRMVNDCFTAVCCTVPVIINVRAVCGEPLYVEAVCAGNRNEEHTVSTIECAASASEYGDVVEHAESRPSTAKDIAENVRKSGGTCFEVTEVNVDTDGDAFVPVGHVKKLRRGVLEKLERTLRTGNRRVYDPTHASDVGEIRKETTEISDYESYSYGVKAINIADKADMADKACIADETGKTRVAGLSVHIHNAKQLAHIASRQDVARIYIDYEIVMRNGDISDITALCDKNGKQAWLVLPHILRSSDYERFDSLVNKAIDGGIYGFVCRSIEEIGFLGSLRKNIRVVADSGIYAFNTHAVDEIVSLCRIAAVELEAVTLPLELTDREMRVVSDCNIPSELVVYGNVPLMISTQCVRKTLGKCDSCRKTTRLEGTKNSKYTVKSMCDFCYSVMYGEKLNITGENLAGFSESSLRYEFDEESINDIKSTLDGLNSSGTSGHFHRPVD